ncbi:MAG: phosphatidate cytidylyltransferase [Chloroflexi bacterium]|uniref:Phosphatidate cytidylyltransferase n=1 Tax=Candidatus Chlorohelix allophototropha TaxID=3003348 RepID=A0A8T7MA30_9CHLR|nr:phosphatidate cytidylyltransferase [Chloroflexota bacterium]NWJ48787.1 phosphatidate cytidylyltransferase [Chloroflexota bacterium]WJW68718.1 phosphatidate cytidylyltransferase [Chloroflexota bacterium L227-S17]
MLVTRILSTVVLVPLVLLFLFFSVETTALLAAIGAVIGAFEFYDMAVRSPYKFNPVRLLGYGLAAFLCLAGYLNSLPLMLLATALYALISGAIILVRPVNSNEPALRNLTNWGISLLGSLYPALPLGLAATLRADSNESLWWIVLALVGTWGTDTGAYFVGRLLGKHKLAPKISPNKTIEGAIGGAVAGMVGVTLVGVLALHIPLYYTIPLGLTLAVGGICGDLFESWFKRRFDTKDSGKLIPGHGGLLDRIDALLIVLTLTYLFKLVYS